MTLNLYSIFDTVAQVFNKPFSDINNATAIRAFSSSIINEPHKDDYALYHLGSYDDSNGKLITNDNPIRILTGFDVKAPEMEGMPETLKNQN